MRSFLMATESDLGGIAGIFAGLMKSIVGPVLIVLGAAAAAYAIYLGVMYAKAEDANKRKEVQGRLIGAAVGLVIILVGIALCFAVDWGKLATTWADEGSKYTTDKKLPASGVIGL